MAAPAAKPDIDTCHTCGKFFPRVYVALCVGCAQVEENRFQLVREYLVRNQGSSLNQVAEGTGLARGEVARFYAEGRLVEVAAGWGAEQTFCTCAIEGGRCGFCRQKLARQLGEAARTPVANPRPAPPGPAKARRSAPRPAGGVGGSSARENGAESDDGRVHYVRRVRREGET